MASAVAATSVSEILRPHRKTDSVAEREGFGPWVSPERVGPESSNENHRRYPGGPGVRISLPPAASHQRTSRKSHRRGRGDSAGCSSVISHQARRESAAVDRNKFEFAIGTPPPAAEPDRDRRSEIATSLHSGEPDPVASRPVSAPCSRWPIARW